MNIKNYSIFGYEKVSKVEFSKTFETIPIKHVGSKNEFHNMEKAIILKYFLKI